MLPPVIKKFGEPILSWVGSSGSRQQGRGCPALIPGDRGGDGAGGHWLRGSWAGLGGRC